MENIEKVVIGIVLFALTSIVAYLFKMRQLYVAVPKLFKNATISPNGSLCELIIYNKGNQVEESIQVSIDPELKCELLASSSSDVTLEGTTIKIDRLHKGCEASALLLIENGVFDATKIISASSKGTSGTVLKKVADLPPNFAKAFIMLLFFIGILPAMIYGVTAYENIHKNYVEFRLATTYKLGWSGLNRYYNSDLRHSYSDQEFPIRLIGSQVNEEKVPILIFEAYNKTAVPLLISADNTHSKPNDISGYESVGVPAMTKKKFSVRAPASTNLSNTASLTFTIKIGDEFLYGLIYTPDPN